MVKAKERETNEWVYGNYMRIVETDTYYVAPHGYHVYKSDELLPNSYMQICGIEVDKNTICRPTMLLDKNGNMIWENDVVMYDKENCLLIVKYTEKLGMWELYYVESRNSYPFTLCEHLNELSVVGNIDDLKEIIEGD